MQQLYDEEAKKETLQIANCKLQIASLITV
jgi:hypothetical protein